MSRYNEGRFPARLEGRQLDEDTFAAAVASISGAEVVQNDSATRSVLIGGKLIEFTSDVPQGSTESEV